VTDRSELNAWWRFALAILGPALRILFDIRTTGIERVPSSGPALLAANHVSALDGIFLCYVVGRDVHRPTRYLVAAEFFAKTFHGFWLRTFKQIPILRGQQDVGALDEAIATVRSGAIAGVFPEGTVNERPEGPLLRGHTGLARMALAVGAPVIPVGIWGTQARWPRSGLTFGPPLRPTVALAFGRPILPTDLSDPLDDVQAFTELVMAGIAEQTRLARSVAERPR
jgi:1-acyl-sn-glycerol-3-phosphate acyltransferase